MAAFDLGASTCQDKLGRIGIESDLPILENFNFPITRVVPWIATFGTGRVLQPSFLKGRRTTGHCLAAFDLGASTCQDKLGRIGIESDLPILENFNFSIMRVVPWMVAFGLGIVLFPGSRLSERTVSFNPRS